MNRCRSFLSLCVAASWSVIVPVAEAAPRFNIYVEQPAVYEVSFEALVETGLEGPVATASIGLRNLGQPVPRWIDDGGDGIFGSGDRLRFIGESLRGEYSYFDPHSRFNCYVLDVADPEPLPGLERSAALDAVGAPAALVSRRHLEPDRLMVRFRATRDEPQEAWYWERLSVADRKPFVLKLVADSVVGRDGDAYPELTPFDDLRAAALADQEPQSLPAFDGASVRLRFGLRGWSKPRHRERESLPHHEVAIRLNGTDIGSTVWDGDDHHIHTIEVPFESFMRGVNKLTIRVPKRRYPVSDDLLVDVVLLNWIELEYAHGPGVGPDQRVLQVADAPGSRVVSLSNRDGRPIEIYLPSGFRVRGEDGVVTTRLSDGEQLLHVVGSAGAPAPDAIYLDRPSMLRANRRQIDYIMITHPRLRRSTERLADFHRSRGLTVEVVEAQDIYDEFNHGVLEPMAIKEFLQHAATAWPSPAPRFVLLVGDASWDFKNATAVDANYADWTFRPYEIRSFSKNRSTPYAHGSDQNDRNLIPTTSFPTTEGHAASDTWLVCFDDGDELPDMAIGRIPVVDPAELEAVIDKTIDFVSSPPVGPWRRNLLFIANESAAFQARSDRIADAYRQLGFASTKIYPHPSEPANEHHTRRILEIVNEGVFAIQFLGHGGRYIWRTGPPDLEKNHDLFTLDHLDELAENGRLPVVLSLTCYSAPFDHPTADSIGEKLLRIPDRGAIAVFAASWRNSPSAQMGRELLDELMVPGTTVGEAVLRAKRRFRSQVLIQTYNLLGDPAVPVAAPMHVLETDVEPDGDTFRVSVSIPFEVRSANLIGEWVAEDGTVIQSDRLAVDGASIVLELGQGSMGTGLRPDGVRLYVWDEERGVDGIAWAEVGAGGGPDRSAAVDDAIAATRGGVAAERTGGGGGR